MVQEILVCILFLLALTYIGRLLYTSFRPARGGCARGCSSCALDIGKLEKELENRQAGVK
ncbi:hypothetical protein [Cesiribacter andamanensis]|uniref:Virus attachment protein p12 family protein n=1 Tax=Cesiribacter andamanensis AMV16 TaxID=1279009 RepID=M7N5M7_9BACT|nr:hypothetical protein [Cesiribacter andamanensis]EMR03933.1 hypothetical protein ADICEAN_00900 [Cesiribacter andamanensis AMV16]